MWQRIPPAWPCVSRGIPWDLASGCCILAVPCTRPSQRSQNPTIRRLQSQTELFPVFQLEWGVWETRFLRSELWAQRRRVVQNQIPPVPQWHGSPLHQTLYSKEEGDGQWTNSESVNKRGPFCNKQWAMNEDKDVWAVWLNMHLLFKQDEMKQVERILTLKPHVNLWNWLGRLC